MSSVEKCWAAVRGEGVTRIPGAAVHVGLIDSQRRRARVISCNAACASFRANTDAASKEKQEFSSFRSSFILKISQNEFLKARRCMDKREERI